MQCLFACLKVKEGDVLGMPSKTRNRHDLIRFLDRCDQEIPVVEGQQIVAVSDNLSTRRTKEVEEWLQEHPRWRFQFTPTHASWLNQVEIFFSILHKRLLKHGAFTSEHDLAEQMLAFIETYPTWDVADRVSRALSLSLHELARMADELETKDRQPTNRPLRQRD